MVQTESTMLALGTPAPDFSLPEPATGKTWSLADFTGNQAFLVTFMCNHCPYVLHIHKQLNALIREYQPRGLAAVAINANDVAAYPADSPEKMAALSREMDYCFPYLFDAEQTVARAYRAACTPDFFLFDKDMKLAYRGQFDASRPGSELPVTGADMGAAIEAILTGDPIPAEAQSPSMGCNIKWKPGNEPTCSS
ncbi:thioredoxin family protein [Sulfuriflexus sp.]|uniref:thioredoxin family protein n=1 Tax=Sulfuriflexus sp. TaxID=2015443 RepID=UPI0028CD65F8|nr:thioredoxin family protein [Sulfuriflexus sp.]MDT8403106.1 thioredoxin family protein [Sulfuriflexus sp.]